MMELKSGMAFSGRHWILNQSEGIIKYGLSRIKKLLEKLDNPQNSFRMIHITGTNGKGSVTAMLTEILKESGFITGSFISPHIDDLSERIKLNGISISEDDLDQAAFLVAQACEEIEEIPSFFERIYATACVFFRIKKVQWGVIEVGLGGRLDATNVSNGEIAILTNVSPDHLKTLGPTLEDILREKSLIVKKCTKYVISGLKSPKHRKYLDYHCHTMGAVVDHRYPFDDIAPISSTLKSQRVRIDNKALDIGEEWEFGLVGPHQRDNLSLVVGAVEKLRLLGVEIKKETLKRALASVKWPGRFELISEKQPIILDGAHNIRGIYALESTLAELELKKISLVMGILKDKEAKKMVKAIRKRVFWASIVQPPVPRGLHRFALEDIFISFDIRCSSYVKLESGIKAAIKRGEGTPILVCGSLYLLGAARKIVKNMNGQPTGN